MKPERAEPWEEWILADDPFPFSVGSTAPTREGPQGTEVLIAAGYTEIWTCKKCKKQVSISA